MQEAVEDRWGHLVDLAQHTHVVRHLPVRVQQNADGELVPAVARGGTGWEGGG